MLAEGGHREELTWAERRLAYGFDWSNVTAQHCSLDLSAVKQRRLEVERRDGRFVALLTIAGKRAALERIFVASHDALRLSAATPTTTVAPSGLRRQSARCPPRTPN